MTLAEEETIPETRKRDITAELRKAFADTSAIIRIPEQLEYQDQTSEKDSRRNTMKRDAGGMIEIGDVSYLKPSPKRRSTTTVNVCKFHGI